MAAAFASGMTGAGWGALNFSAACKQRVYVLDNYFTKKQIAQGVKEIPFLTAYLDLSLLA